jgi:hypothetical protein
MMFERCPLTVTLDVVLVDPAFHGILPSARSREPPEDEDGPIRS